jgi:hypothetical protein
MPSSKSCLTVAVCTFWFRQMGTSTGVWPIASLPRKRRFHSERFPEVSLKEAREKRDKARKLLAEGIDPAQQKRHEKLARETSAENTFEAIALEWLEFVSSKLSPDTVTRNRSLLTNNLFPWLGKYPIADMTPMDLLAALKRVEEKGIVDTAHRLKQLSGQIFRYAVVTGVRLAISVLT